MILFKRTKNNINYNKHPFMRVQTIVDLFVGRPAVNSTTEWYVVVYATLLLPSINLLPVTTL